MKFPLNAFPLFLAGLVGTVGSMGPSVFAGGLASGASSQWHVEAQKAYDDLQKNPQAAQAKLKGAYALFQNGYSNSALWFLKKISPLDWKKLPQGEDRFAEIVLLFQKKVPLNFLPGRLEQLSTSVSSPYLQDEIRFSKGREKFEAKQYQAASELFSAVSKTSRFYRQSRYFLATIAVERKEYSTAAVEFSEVFEPTSLDQSSEFWTDMNAQMTSHWGTNMKVQLDTSGLVEASTVGELALLGLARVAYASHDYGAALRYYGRISPQSPFFPAASLEKTWSLLALNRHEEAQIEAKALAVNGASFESIESKVLRALILTDAGKPEEARVELDSYQAAARLARAGMNEYKINLSLTSLPLFITKDLAEDHRLKVIQTYQANLETEIHTLHQLDHSLYPLYSRLEGELLPLVLESKAYEKRLVEETISKRIRDLEYLDSQAPLVRIETYLEDRENLRSEFNQMKQVSEEKQKEHDLRLIEILNHAVNETDLFIQNSEKSPVALTFRQSELIWELATAKAILDQNTDRKIHSDSVNDAVSQLRLRALAMAEKVIQDYPDFPKRPDALFFKGLMQVELGKIKLGSQTLHAYVNTYKQHLHVPDAYRILADLEFDENKFDSAENYFKKVLEFQDSSVVGYALYKIGWCAYNQKSFARALLAFEKSILWAHSLFQFQSLNLHREAKHDLISIYAEVGDYSKANEYFKRFYSEGASQATTQAEQAKEWLSQFASVLDTLGQFEKSSEIYQELIQLDAKEKGNIPYYVAMIQGAFRLHRWESVIKASEQMLLRFKTEFSQPPSVKELAQSPQVKDKVMAEEVLRQIVLAGLSESKASPEKEDVERMRKLNELYFSTFDSWKEIEEPLYRHAQFLLKAGFIPDALVYFHLHWDRFQEKLQEPKREEALRNLIYALNQQEDHSKERVEKISEQGIELFKLIDGYLGRYRESKYNRPLTYLKSALLFKYGQMEKGLTESQALFELNPKDDIGKRAFKNSRFFRYEKKEWEGTYRWASALLAKKSLASIAYQEDLKKIVSESAFLWADQAPDDLKSAELFKQLAKDPQMEGLKEKALFNAFVRLKKANHKAEALQVAEELEAYSPNDSGLLTIQGLRAALLQEAGDYERAFPVLEKFLKTPPQKVSAETLQQARLNAGLIAESLKLFPIAKEHYETYLKGVGQNELGTTEAKNALTRLASLRELKKEPVWDGWAELLRKKAVFEKNPLLQGKDLATRIKKSGENLENVVKGVLTSIKSSQTPVSFALESYCTLPFLYDSYATAIVQLGSGDLDLLGELKRVAEPIQKKAQDLATECLTKSMDAFHDGKFFRLVNARWGWASDPILDRTVTEVISQLEVGYPYLDPPLVPYSQAEIISRHLKDQGSFETWYTLAVLRANQKRYGLSRLTLADLLSKETHSGLSQNAFAVVNSLIFDDPPETLSSLYEAAGKMGSKSAWMNLALIKLRAGKLREARRSLERAEAVGILTKTEALVRLMREGDSK